MARRPRLGGTRKALGLVLGLAAVILAVVPGIVIAADPPDFEVPPTPPQGATLTVTVGQTPVFTVQVSDVDVLANVTQITVGSSHTCALLDTGAVRCWGLGDSGQLGYGNVSRIGDDETLLRQGTWTWAAP